MGTHDAKPALNKSLGTVGHLMACVFVEALPQCIIDRKRCGHRITLDEARDVLFNQKIMLASMEI